LGSSVLESYQLLRHGLTLEISYASYLIAFSSSAFIGLIALKLVERLGIETILRYFAGYCMTLGILCLWLK
jgi:undecaprenyl pyrophosphate phosphatase UppP